MSEGFWQVDSIKRRMQPPLLLRLLLLAVGATVAFRGGYGFQQRGSAKQWCQRHRLAAKPSDNIIVQDGLKEASKSKPRKKILKSASMKETAAAVIEPSVDGSVLFYPKVPSDLPADPAKQSEDDMLYDMFLRQISDINTRSPAPQRSVDVDSEEGRSGGDYSQSAAVVSMPTKLGSILNTKRLIEQAIKIRPNCPIEFIYKRRVVFGNYVARKSPTGSGLVVRLTTGEVISIDASQVISCWDLLADDVAPTTSQDWAQVAADALTILGNMSPRKSDLEEFWQIISQRSNAVPVDSLDLGIYIFQERRFRSWVNPYASAQESAVRALAAGQRYAASLLLYHDDFHFKRRPSVLLSKEEAAAREHQQRTEECGPGGGEGEGEERAAGDIATGANYSLEDLLSEDTRRRFAASQGAKRDDDDSGGEEGGVEDERVHDGEGSAEDDANTLNLLEGAYKCLEENTVLFREEEVFHKYYLQRSFDKLGDSSAVGAEKAAPFRAGCITRQLRALEMYSMSPTSLAPPTSVKQILKKLGKPASPEGAKMVIKDMRIEVPRWSSRGASEAGGGGAAATAAAGLQVKRAEAMRVSNTPWSVEILSAAEELCADVTARRTVLTDTFSGRAGKRGPSGRMDYRSNNDEHPVICIDGSKAVFLDDAFSLSPETGEILVHVVDVVGTLRRYEILQDTAKERISSAFLPSGPMHMLPPAALEALKLSTTGANEVITVGLSVDDKDGTLLGIRVFPSVIGPVFPVDIDTADEILDGVSSGDKEWNVKLGYPASVVKDLVTAQRLVEMVIAKQPWADTHFSAGTQRTFSLNKRTGAYKQAFVDKTPGNRMVNALLTLYSNATCTFCNAHGVSVPISWENRDRSDSTMIRRFATQPLRNWLAQLQQKQLRAALKMELSLSRKDCAMSVAHHNSRRKQMSSLQTAGRDIMSFESLESHCAAVLGSGQHEVVLQAEGLGRGGTVKLVDFKVIGMVMTNVPKGAQVRVRVKKVVAETRTVHLELLE